MAVSAYPPFDFCYAMFESRKLGSIVYLGSPLDLQYTHVPTGEVPPGLLPPEEYEMRDAIEALREATKAIRRVRHLDRLFSKPEYLAAKERLDDMRTNLRARVWCSRECRAALTRMVYVMPNGRERRQLMRFLR